jgi:hypothetical protein
MSGVTVPKWDRLWRMDLWMKDRCPRTQYSSGGVMGRGLGAVQSQHSSRNRTRTGTGILCEGYGNLYNLQRESLMCTSLLGR